LVLAGLGILPSPVLSAANRDLFQFEGQVTLPPHTVGSKKRLIVLLRSLETPYIGQTPADAAGRFAFRDLTPGTYGLVIYIPDKGELQQTLDISESFADAKRTVRRNFQFNEQSLSLLLTDPSGGLVSVRQLSIPAKSNEEYAEAQRRLEHNDTEGAVEHLEKAVALAPQFVEALNHLGTIYFQRRDFPKAESYFRTALERDPQAYEPLVNLGGTLLAEERWREALGVNLHALNTRPGDPLANAQVGLSYFAIRDYEHAIPWFRATEERDPANFSNPQIALAEIYLTLADTAAAVRELQSFLKVHPDSRRAQQVREAIVKLQTTQGERPSQPEPLKRVWVE